MPLLAVHHWTQADASATVRAVAGLNTNRSSDDARRLRESIDFGRWSVVGRLTGRGACNLQEFFARDRGCSLFHAQPKWKHFPPNY